MAAVVRTFSKGAAETGRGQGRMRANYGAAMKQKTAGLEAAAAKYNAGVIGAREMAVLQQIYIEQALGTLAGGINSVTEGLNFLVPLGDKSLGLLKLLSGSMMTVRGALAVHRMWTTYIEMRRRRQLALAVVESLRPRFWPLVPGALAAAAITAAALGSGYAIGHELGARARDGGTVDLGDVGSRRQAINTMRGVGMGVG